MFRSSFRESSIYTIFVDFLLLRRPEQKLLCLIKCFFLMIKSICCSIPCLYVTIFKRITRVFSCTIQQSNISINKNIDWKTFDFCCWEELKQIKRFRTAFFYIYYYYKSEEFINLIFFLRFFQLNSTVFFVREKDLFSCKI